MFLNNVNKYVSVLQTNRTLLSMFCRRGSSPFGKVVPHEPPYPSEITAFEPSPPPSPLEFPVILHAGEGPGMDIFWNHTMVVHSTV